MNLRELAKKSYDAIKNTKSIYDIYKDDENFALEDKDTSIFDTVQVDTSSLTYKENTDHPIHKTAYYTLASELEGIITIDDLKLSIGFRYNKTGGYSASFLRLLGQCPKCHEEVLSSPIFGLVSLGLMLDEFEPDEMLHECPVDTSESNNKIITEWTKRALSNLGLKLTE